MVQALSPSLFKDTHFSHRTYVARVPHGTQFEDVLHPMFWAHVTTTLRDLDRIEVVADDGSFDAEVRFHAPRQAGQPPRIVLLRAPLTQPGLEPVRLAPNDYLVEHVPAHRWRVVDPKKDVIAKGMGTREEAEAWLAQHLRDHNLIAA